MYISQRNHLGHIEIRSEFCTFDPVKKYKEPAYSKTHLHRLRVSMHAHTHAQMQTHAHLYVGICCRIGSTPLQSGGQIAEEANIRLLYRSDFSCEACSPTHTTHIQTYFKDYWSSLACGKNNFHIKQRSFGLIIHVRGPKLICE